MKLLFKNWFKLIEMAYSQVGGDNFKRFKDKHINDWPYDQGLGWMHKMMLADPRKMFNFTDEDGKQLTRKQLLQAFEVRSKGKKIAPVRNGKDVVADDQLKIQFPTTQQIITPSQDKIWYKASVLAPTNGLNFGDIIAVSKNNDKWEFISSDGRKGILSISTDQLKTYIKREVNELGEIIQSKNPQDFFKDDLKKVENPQTTEKRTTQQTVGQDGKSLVIPPHYMTEYNKAIASEFADTDNPIMINALAGTGKAQPLDSLLLTPVGWVKMGDIKIGDQVFGSDGLPHKVSGVFPQGQKEVFEITFSDGVKVECCKDHLWKTETKKNRDKCRTKKMPLFSFSKILTTEEIKKTILYKNYSNHYIPLTSPLHFERNEVIIDPYTMGVLLGDGCFRTGSINYSSMDEEIINSVNNSLPKNINSSKIAENKCDYRICGKIKGKRNPIVAEIKRLGLWKKLSDDKFIPYVYKFNDINSRIAILQGLLDTDGHCNETSVNYYSTSKTLAEDVRFLVESIGGTTTITMKFPKFTYKGVKKSGKICYVLNLKIPSGINPFRLKRKRIKYCPKIKYLPKRTIVSIEPIGKKECQCISINSVDNLYITNNCVLTHNTTMLKHLSSFIRPNEKWLYLVFNKKNQMESSKAFPANVDVLTTHAFLGRILKANGKSVGGDMQLPPRGQKIEKLAKILDEFIPKTDLSFKSTNGRPLRYQAINRIKKIARLAKAFGVNPSSSTVINELKEIIKRYNIDMDLSSEKLQQSRDYTEDILKKTRELLILLLPGNLPRQFDQQFAGQRDQDDTLWFTAINADSIRWNVNPKYDVILMDEVQDFNMCQLIMAKKLKESGARLVGVGDPNQSMYMFRGAVSDAFDQLQNIISGNKKPMELPINFRSNPVVIDFVKENTHVKNLQASPSKNPEAGEATTHMKYEDYLTSTIDDYQQKGRKFDQSNAMISRNNAPLASTAMNLLKNNVDFEILGRDLSNELVDHIKKVTWYKPQNYGIHDLSNIFFDYYANLQREWDGKTHKEDELKEIEETTNSLISVLEHLSGRDNKDENDKQIATGLDFIEYIKDKLGGLDPENEQDVEKLKAKDPHSYITLTTAHKSKGLEWDKVFVIRKDDFTKVKPDTTEEEAQQQRNSWYVTLTRARHSINVSADDKP